MGILALSGSKIHVDDDFPLVTIPDGFAAGIAAVVIRPSQRPHRCILFAASAKPSEDFGDVERGAADLFYNCGDDPVARPLADDFKELVRSRTDIVGLISEVVTLERRGREHLGLCPFHEDHSPSMHVNPERQSWRCWVCNDGGDVFSFVMKHDRMSFREALLHLAERANVPVPKSVRDQGDVSVRSSMYEVLGWAEKQFHELLLQSPQAQRARDYLRKRGISSDSIEKYRLGYHPDSWDWVLRRSANQFAIDQLLEARLVSARENNAGHYDFVGLIDRIQFPIHDSRGRCVAFGGRILPDSPRADAAKYINSPESELFNKSQLLYGMDIARDAIAKAGEVIVTEGYTDCILCHQHGIGNVVGTLGTALTERHVAELKRFARRVILVYDGDAAGQRATERSLSKFLAHEVDLRILTLPDDLDPADFLVARGRHAFNTLLSQSVEAWDYKLRTTIARYGLDSVDSRHRVLTDMLDVVAAVPVNHSSGMSSAWQNRKNVILGTLSQRLGIPESTIRTSLATLLAERNRRGMGTASSVSSDSRSGSGVTGRSAGTRTRQGSPVRKVSPREQVERELLEVILTLPETIGKVVASISPADVQTPALRSLFELCLAVSNTGHSPSYHNVTSTLEDLELKRLAAELDDEAQRGGVNETLLAGVLQYLQLHRPALSRSSASGGIVSAAPSLFSDSSFSASDSESSTPPSPLDGAVPPEDLARLQAAFDAARQRQSLSSPSS